MKHFEVAQVSSAIGVPQLFAAREWRFSEAFAWTEHALVVGERRDLGVAVGCDVVRDGVRRNSTILGNVIARQKIRIHLDQNSLNLIQNLLLF